MNIQQIIKENHLEQWFFQGTFGIEKEGHRIDAHGNIMTSPHPHIFGNRSYHPYIQTDFAESQLELITPTAKSIQECLRWLGTIHEVVWRSLPENEYITPLSMPTDLSNLESIKVAQFDDPKDVAYRDYLVNVYGKAKQMVSGIHYNFQIDPFVTEQIFQKQEKYSHYLDFNNAFYLKIAKNFFRYQWVLVYLLSASPTVDPAYFSSFNKAPAIPFVRSLRSSQYGYVNHPDIQVSFNSIEDYVRTLEEHVQAGRLIAEKEFYSNVRFRGGSQARELLSRGIQYLEFRLFDLNPFAPYGITQADAQFIHAFILLMAWMDETADNEGVKKGQDYLNQVALENPFEPTVHQDEGIQLIKQMMAMLQTLHADPSYLDIAQQKLDLFHHPEQTLSAQLVTAIKSTGSAKQLASEIAIKNKAQALETPYCLSAFQHMELSTQALIFDAIQKGIATEILDEQDQFLCLKHRSHIEYVKNGNMTSRDQYIAPLIMENKVVTKKVLEKAGFRVPKSTQYLTLEQAIADFALYEHKAIVIKPKSTNFGLGITIFRQGPQNFEDFVQAVKIAFKEDKEIMIEAFIPGTEYRFFVLGNETLAILLRVPAHVIGDGEHTVSELIDEKNRHPLRGDGSRTPLKKIQKGDIEILQLKEQGLTLDSIPKKGEHVLLRANSNISTGGDSIDMTDQMDESYKKLAVGITQAMGAAVCGVDMMITDYTQPASENNWGVIETNFNPMMMMHIFPYQGKSRRISLNVLQMLFPELKII
ncbi:bifunctional glutamate--cysteine ligase GshA/glutathione synthetase GshB [Basilea psittacipulmonis]|uniref:Glutathione biosynthesis bifunctional protein GshAB n=1 Tax=Basilea psittacipulmonis DSM 24701 TaxID=1072685 RepID=A0A077DHK5_9BURK|nr:bifunctional glutamate--cysteine ligase GshA/glutathione synthetase GshB [Basilea psittacipulmonis]AIL32623.1 bifunctional glutamate--cysteine ligase/glutathione synthetase [Basilea psittacipulmonis DSM 24701]